MKTSDLDINYGD